MRSRFLAGLMSVALVLSAHAVAAQDAGTLNEDESSPNQEQGAALLTLLNSGLNDVFKALGYEVSPTMSGLTAEMFAASIPYTSDQDIEGTSEIVIGLGIQPPEALRTSPEQAFEYSAGNISSLSEDEERFSKTRGYVLLNDAIECKSSHGSGQVAAFRRFASGNARGHLCVVVTHDDATGLWHVRAHSVAVAGEQRARSYYAIRVGVEGDADRARLLGETRLDAIIDIGNILTKYTMGLAELDRQDYSNDEAMAAWQRIEEVIDLETEVDGPEVIGAKFRDRVVQNLSRVTDTLGLDVPELTVGLTLPVVQASFGGRWIDGLKGSGFDTQYRAWTPSAAEPDRPRDFTVMSDEATCRTNLQEGGQMVGFRKLALDQVAEGHQCIGVWANDDGTTWTLVSNSVSIAGHISVLSTYQMTIRGDVGTDAARLFGEEGQSRMIAIAALLADYGLAISVASYQTWASQYAAQPEGIIQRLKERLLVGVSSGAATANTD